MLSKLFRSLNVGHRDAIVCVDYIVVQIFHFILSLWLYCWLCRCMLSIQWTHTLLRTHHLVSVRRESKRARSKLRRNKYEKKKWKETEKKNQQNYINISFNRIKLNDYAPRKGKSERRETKMCVIFWMYWRSILLTLHVYDHRKVECGCCCSFVGCCSAQFQYVLNDRQTVALTKNLETNEQKKNWAKQRKSQREWNK